MGGNLNAYTFSHLGGFPAVQETAGDQVDVLNPSASRKDFFGYPKA